MAGGELITRPNIERDPALFQDSFQFRRRYCLELRQVGERRRASAIDLGVLQKIFGARRQIAGQLSDEFFPAL